MMMICHVAISLICHTHLTNPENGDNKLYVYIDRR